MVAVLFPASFQHPFNQERNNSKWHHLPSPPLKDLPLSCQSLHEGDLFQESGITNAQACSFSGFIYEEFV
jgi:hypothetical protein